MSAWVKCSERMPKLGEEVNVAYRNGLGTLSVSSMVYGCSYETTEPNEWHSIDDADETYGHLSVECWQPLPDPPEVQP